jgi:endonuclease/exonuclease/phosphatase (EEP) superfamily protein YafD
MTTSIPRLLVLACCWAYLAGLGLWLVEWLLIGDQAEDLFTINGLALYLFLPLPLVPPVALWTRRPELGIAVLLAAALWLYLWGGLFLPRSPDAPAGAPRLTVMTYNVLGWNRRPDAVVQVIRESGADIVGLVELNPAISAAIERDLAAEYPYRIMDPRVGTDGSGLISKLPFRVLEGLLADDDWVSDPLVLELDVDDRRVTYVRFHAIATPSFWHERARQVRKLADYARQHDGPIIFAGDLNATPTNDDYQTLTGPLTDAWAEAGRGFGHTFPGASREETPGSSTPQLFGRPLPKWLVRIDYIFHSSHWRTLAARNPPHDGASDHRPVLAELALID